MSKCSRLDLLQLYIWWRWPKVQTTLLLEPGGRISPLVDVGLLYVMDPSRAFLLLLLLLLLLLGEMVGCKENFW